MDVGLNVYLQKKQPTSLSWQLGMKLLSLQKNRNVYLRPLFIMLSGATDRVDMVERNKRLINTGQILCFSGDF